ncbi:MAG: N-acetylglucosamine-6-phosphate deacetylase [candidate division NC10 bacterium]|nr:N-acetylglucosamine-6-phosphate deacetylase [candidate division NC10 bacterium]
MSTSVVVQGRLTRGAAPVEILVAEGRIEAIRPPGATTDCPIVGGADCLVAEGFMDMQVNGFAAVDFNRPALTGEEIRRATEAMWRTGVTQFLPTVVTAPVRDMLGTLKAIARAREQDPAVRRAIPGIHLEGPFLAPEDGPRGAHPADSIRDPDWGLFQQFQDAAGGLIRLVTLAPERPGAIGLIWQLCQAGIVVGIGHSDAKEADIDQAVEAGARISCHLGNGSHAMLPRHRNYIQKQLATDALMASLIVDGHHLPSYVVKNMIRCKRMNHVILVTDAMAAAAAPPGKYRLGEVLAEVGPDGYVRLPGTPYLAGSALTMDRAVENVTRFAGLSLDEAILLATRQPRRLFPDLGAGLVPGARADLVVLREGPPLTVETTIVEGEVVYRRN